jgi:hypothetical protein
MVEFRSSSAETDAAGVGQVSFEDWIGGRKVLSLGTNAGSTQLPFQDWRHFKEAFAPELIQRAILESPIPVRRCIDPFAGSGTTALACQFLGVHPITIEVNPYLADLTEAKLATYDVDALGRDFARLIKLANRKKLNPNRFFAEAPPTFVEPGVEQRWIFDTSVATRIAAFVSCLPLIRNVQNRRLLRVLLGGVLVELSNVVISGKGRRYRKGWDLRPKTASDLDEALCNAVEHAVGDILRYGCRRESAFTMIRGDARDKLRGVKPVDIAIFSPPYPNSFDYTDVYNVELWGLGYLTKRDHNTRLRHSTLASHVQIKRFFLAAPSESKSLQSAVKALQEQRNDLWDARIPEMVGGYFADMAKIISGVTSKLRPNGQIWMVVGDSKYAGVAIPVAKILSELAKSLGCRLTHTEPFRAMRTSAQQGNAASLRESLLILSRL